MTRDTDSLIVLSPTCRVSLDDPWNAVRLLSPDLGVFVMSLITLVLCKRLLKRREEGSAEHGFHQEVGGLRL